MSLYVVTHQDLNGEWCFIEDANSQALIFKDRVKAHKRMLDAIKHYEFILDGSPRYKGFFAMFPAERQTVSERDKEYFTNAINTMTVKKATSLKFEDNTYIKGSDECPTKNQTQTN